MHTTVYTYTHSQLWQNVPWNFIPAFPMLLCVALKAENKIKSDMVFGKFLF